MGNAHGMLVAVGAIVAREGKAGRVALVQAQREAFLGPDRQRPCRQQQVAARGRGFIEGTAKLEAVAPLGIDACTQQQIEGVVGKTLRRERQGPLGKAQALQNHRGHGFVRRNHCWIIWHETPVNHIKQP